MKGIVTRETRVDRFTMKEARIKIREAALVNFNVKVH